MNLEPNFISFRDYNARVIKEDGLYKRIIFNSYKDEYNHLMDSGLYEELTNKKLLISHIETQSNEKNSNAYKTILPEQIKFISYPYEWSFNQWRKAILTFLRINKIALKYGMILKDATPFNFYIHQGRAIMLDTSSFAFYKNNDPWLSYRQFSEMFFGPMALMFYQDTNWGANLSSNLEGFPLNFISKHLPIRSWFNISCLIHIHLHASYSNQKKKNSTKSKGFTIDKLQAIFNQIEDNIKRWKMPKSFSNHWNNYYEKEIESPIYLKDKEHTIDSWLSSLNFETTLDLGTNTGNFAIIAAKYSKQVIAIDSDNYCISSFDKKIKSENLVNIDTLVGDLAQPSPDLGFGNKEHYSFASRSKSDLVLSLALIHHLYLSKGLSLPNIASVLKQLTNKFLLVEYIDVNDMKFKQMTTDKIIFELNYSEDMFLKSFERDFNLLKLHKLNDSKRTLYLFEIK